jgi:hypothetical protein
LTIDFDSLTICIKHKRTVSLVSDRFGSCCLIFEGKVPAGLPKTNTLELKSSVTAQWRQNLISNCEYLVWVNLLSGRTFACLWKYPVFPRVLDTFTRDTFPAELPAVRSLNFPIGVLSNPDTENKLFTMRELSQGYHHCENISTTASVTFFLIRLMPFLRAQLAYHSGWDLESRLFMSIPGSFSLSSNSLCEFPPECYLCPEMFENLNGLRPRGTFLDMVFPQWAADGYQFIDFHRYALECLLVRSNLHSWIDLTFGFQQRGPEAAKVFNLYNPIGYEDAELSGENAEMQGVWVQSCGQVPVQLFELPHEQFDPKPNFKDLHFTLNPSPIENEVSSIFPISAHCHLSNRKQYCVITLLNGIVQVFRIKRRPSKLVHLISFVKPSSKFSIINDRQLICATVFPSEIIIWSFHTGAIINILSYANVNLLVFDDELNHLYCTVDSTIFQFSLNGRLMHKHEVVTEITALDFVALDFTLDHRFLLVGLMDGNVLLVGHDFQTGSLYTFKSHSIGMGPILKFSLPEEPQSHEIAVYDTNSKFSSHVTK